MSDIKTQLAFDIARTSLEMAIRYHNDPTCGTSRITITAGEFEDILIESTKRTEHKLSEIELSETEAEDRGQEWTPSEPPINIFKLTDLQSDQISDGSVVRLFGYINNTNRGIGMFSISLQSVEVDVRIPIQYFPLIQCIPTHDPEIALGRMYAVEARIASTMYGRQLEFRRIAEVTKISDDFYKDFQTASAGNLFRLEGTLSPPKSQACGNRQAHIFIHSDNWRVAIKADPFGKGITDLFDNHGSTTGVDVEIIAVAYNSGASCYLELLNIRKKDSKVEELEAAYTAKTKREFDNLMVQTRNDIIVSAIFRFVQADEYKISVAFDSGGGRNFKISDQLKSSLVDGTIPKLSYMDTVEFFFKNVGDICEPKWIPYHIRKLSSASPEETEDVILDQSG